MTKHYRIFFFLFLYGTVLIASESEIRARLNQWPRDFREKNVSEVCGLFAPDLVASYPGTQDKNYDQMCKQLSYAMDNEEKYYDYALPEIEEVIIDKDIAVVRLIWTLTTIDRKTKTKEIIKEKGLDVFHQQPDKSWKIRISYAYSLD